MSCCCMLLFLHIEGNEGKEMDHDACYHSLVCWLADWPVRLIYGTGSNLLVVLGVITNHLSYFEHVKDAFIFP